MTVGPDATVILLRHGTSPTGFGRDRERPLGEGVAVELRSRAGAIAGRGAVTALVSSARRTAETADAVLDALVVERREDLDVLYDADAATIRAAADGAISAGASVVLVVGHNPGISAAAYELSGGRSADIMRPGDAVICERRGGEWRPAERVALQAR